MFVVGYIFVPCMLFTIKIRTAAISRLVCRNERLSAVCIFAFFFDFFGGVDDFDLPIVRIKNCKSCNLLYFHRSLREMTENQAIATPPGRKLLRKIEETSRGGFYLLKAKMSHDVPRISGQSGEIIDLTVEKTPAIDQKEALLRRIRKLKDEPDAEAPQSAASSDANGTSSRGFDAPGSKLRTLKNELEPKMRQQWKEALKKRCELWELEQKTTTRKDDSEKVKVKDADLSEDRGRESIEDGNSVSPVVVIAQDNVEESINSDDRGEFGQQENPIDLLQTDSNSESRSEPHVNENSALNVDPDRWTFAAVDTESNNARPSAVSPRVPKFYPIFASRTKSEEGYFTSNQSSFFELEKTQVSPNVSRSSASVDKNDSIAVARRLLAGVLNEDDTRAPTSQDILNVCSGQFVLTGNDGSNADKSCEIHVSTPASKRVPRLSCDLFDTSTGSCVQKDSGDHIVNCPDESEDSDSEVHQNPRGDTSNGACIVTVKRNRLLSDSDQSGKEFDNGDECDGDISDEEDEAEVCDENDVDDEKESGDECSMDTFGAEQDNGELDEEDLYALKIKESKKYFDDEAELSGSDVGADENEDDADQDSYESELGDQDDVPSEDELRNQIGRYHLKQVMNDDKRELLRYTEAYIRDDGDDALRFRFRWKRNEAEEDDNFGDQHLNVAGVDAGHDLDESDEAWQDSLKQRAKWTTAHGMSVEDALADSEDICGNGHFFNTAKVALHRSVSSTVNYTDESVPAASQGPLVSHNFMSLNWTNRSHSSFFGRESLLKRDSTILGKLTVDANNSGTTSRNKASAVFSIVSPKQEGADESRCFKRASDGDATVTADKKRKAVLKSESQSIFEALK